MDDITGQTLANRYTVDKLLGQGGQARVYRAYDQRTHKWVALKILNPDLSEDRLATQRFHKEAQMLGSLNHAHIVPFYNFIQEGHLACMVLGLVEGTNLREIIFDRKTPFSLEEAVVYIYPIALALTVAHAQGIVHRDIKPANILIDQGGFVYVSDFGVARIIEMSTATRGTAGTTGYMSPEQVRGYSADARSDVYAFGILIYEMFTLNRPFTGKHGPENLDLRGRLIWEQLSQPAPSLRQINPYLDPAIEQIVLRCLELDPVHRYQSMTEVLAAFQSAQPTEWERGMRRYAATYAYSGNAPEPTPPLGPDLGSKSGVTFQNPWALAGMLFSVFSGFLLIISIAWLLFKPTSHPTQTPPASEVLPSLTRSSESIPDTPVPEKAMEISVPVKGDQPFAMTTLTDHPDVWPAKPTFNKNFQTPSAEVAGDYDIKITLNWSSVDDLDLVVYDPSNTRISSDSPTSPSGGRLLANANADCVNTSERAEEMIYWKWNTAPQGNYRIQVRYAQSCRHPTEAVFFQVFIQVGQNIISDSGTAYNPGETIILTSFTR